jgi:hypothetical protein
MEDGVGAEQVPPAMPTGAEMDAAAQRVLVTLKAITEQGTPVPLAVVASSDDIAVLVAGAQRFEYILALVPGALSKQGTAWSVPQAGNQAAREKTCADARGMLGLFVAQVVEWRKTEAKATAAAAATAATAPQDGMMEILRALKGKAAGDAAEIAMANPTEPSGVAPLGTSRHPPPPVSFRLPPPPPYPPYPTPASFFRRRVPAHGTRASAQPYLAPVFTARLWVLDL